jgi:hypothetical protein
MSLYAFACPHGQHHRRAQMRCSGGLAMVRRSVVALEGFLSRRSGVWTSCSGTISLLIGDISPAASGLKEEAPVISDDQRHGRPGQPSVSGDDHPYGA